MNDQQVLQLLNMSIGNLRVMAEGVEDALRDDRITPFEAMMLAGQAMNMGVSMYGMFKNNQESIGDIVNVLRRVEFTVKP